MCFRAQRTDSKLAFVEHHLHSCTGLSFLHLIYCLYSAAETPETGCYCSSAQEGRASKVGLPVQHHRLIGGGLSDSKSHALAQPGAALSSLTAHILHFLLDHNPFGTSLMSVSCYSIIIFPQRDYKFFESRDHVFSDATSVYTTPNDVQGTDLGLSQELPSRSRAAPRSPSETADTKCCNGLGLSAAGQGSPGGSKGPGQTQKERQMPMFSAQCKQPPALGEHVTTGWRMEPQLCLEAQDKYLETVGSAPPLRPPRNYQPCPCLPQELGGWSKPSSRRRRQSAWIGKALQAGGTARAKACGGTVLGLVRQESS